jgi:hypothetical protein
MVYDGKYGKILLKWMIWRLPLFQETSTCSLVVSSRIHVEYLGKKHADLPSKFDRWARNHSWRILPEAI